MIKHLYKKTGFTLIELSIVLVIIGLIIGGVMVGRDLIDTSKARSYLGQLSEYEVAFNTFRLKYNCIPGDCKTASQFGLGSNGNGDTLLNGSSYICNSTCSGPPDYSRLEGPPVAGVFHHRGYGEAQWFWAHLSAAGLIKDGIATLSTPDGEAGLIGDELTPYFPKLNHSSGYLIAFTWGGRTFIKNGVSSLSTPYGKPAYTDTSTKGLHVQYMANKLGYGIMPDDNYTACANHYCDYPKAIRAGLRFIASSPANGRVYQASTIATAGYSLCVSNSSGTLAYVMNGHCQFLWRMQ